VATQQSLLPLSVPVSAWAHSLAHSLAQAVAQLLAQALAQAAAPSLTVASRRSVWALLEPPPIESRPDTLIHSIGARAPRAAS
jgi:hypothetical protein